MSKFEFAGVGIGMRADDLIRILKPRGTRAIRSGWTDKNKFGLIAKWLFPDGTVITLARSAFPGPYEVTEIEYDKYTPEEINALDLNTMLPDDRLPKEEYSEEIKKMQPKKRKRKKASR